MRAGVAAWTKPGRPLGVDLSLMKLPPGFEVDYYWKGPIADARSICLSKSSRRGGPVITYVTSQDFTQVAAQQL